MKSKKYALYRKVIKVELLGTKTDSWGIKLTDIKFSNGVRYSCLPEELTKINESMKVKEFIVFDVINGGLEEFDTIEEAKAFIKKEFIDPDDGIHPDIELLFIAKKAIEY